MRVREEEGEEEERRIDKIKLISEISRKGRKRVRKKSINLDIHTTLLFTTHSTHNISLCLNHHA